MSHVFSPVSRVVAWASLSLFLIFPDKAYAQSCAPQRLAPQPFQQFDYFGWSVDLDGEWAVAGSNSFRNVVAVFRWNGVVWNYHSTLTRNDGTDNIGFGLSVAIEGDTIVVGAPYADSSGITNHGAAYVFVRAGSTWVQQARLETPSRATGDALGSDVAISGNTILASAPLDDVGPGLDEGSVSVFTRSGTTWSQQATLSVADRAGGDNLGESIAIDGDTIVAGLPNRNTARGEAAVFVRTGVTWSEQARLVASDGAADDRFGTDVAIDGDTVAVGSPFASASGGSSDHGAAYVFTRAGSVWSLEAKLTGVVMPFVTPLVGYRVALKGDTLVATAPQAASGNLLFNGEAATFTRSGTTWTEGPRLSSPAGWLDGDNFQVFGSAIAIEEGRAMVGCPIANTDGLSVETGAVWMFEQVGTTWVGVPRIIESSDGVPDDKFGLSVAVDGDYMAIGARDDDHGSVTNQGSVYVYERTSRSAPWVQVAKLISDGGAGDEFGERLAIQGNTLVVGATIENAARGRAYVYRRIGGTWTFVQHLAADVRTPGDRFGNDLAMDGNTLVIGAFLDDGQKGSAFVFTRPGPTNSYTLQAKLQPADTALNDYFGTSVDIDGDTIIAGAPGDDYGQNNQGTVSIYTRSGSTWTERTKFSTSDIDPDTFFGEYVAIDNGTILVGSMRSFSGSIRPGAAYVYTGSGSVWTFQARLDPPDGRNEDRFGSRLALQGDVAVIGATLSDIHDFGIIDSGAAYIYSRLGTSWTFRKKLTAFDVRPNEYFGAGLWLDGADVYVGAGARQVGGNSQQGSVYILPTESECAVAVQNLSLGTSYGSIAAALTPSSSGHQIVGSAGAWGAVTTVDTLGRSLGLASSSWLVTPSPSTLTLGGSSYLSAADGHPMTINGNLRVSAGASADLRASEFRLGASGILTARIGSSLFIDASGSELLGETRAEQGASLTFTGNASSSGTLSLASNAQVVADGVLANRGTMSAVSASVSTLLMLNASEFNLLGTNAIFGDFTNDAGATTTIRGDTLYVFGSLTNNGTIIGSLCAGCRTLEPRLDILGDLVLGPDASLSLPFTGSRVSVGGSFDAAIDDHARFDMSVATLRFEGADEQTMEAMSADIGADAAGLDRTLAGHFPIGTLHIGPSASTVRVVDARDNDGNGQTGAEAVYVRSLQIGAGSRLINPTTIVYYETLDNQGTLDHPSNVIQIGTPPCLGDYTGDGAVDVLDFLDFFDDYGTCDNQPMPCGTWGNPDLNGDTFVDVLDFLDFLDAFGNGC